MTDPAAGDLDDRPGLDEDFLGVPVPLPAADVETVRLDYRHFSVRLRPDRRLAAVTAVGIDGAQLRDLSRDGIDWRFDPRVPAGQQTGDDVYARNDLDRGHLVRRADAVWGATVEEAQQGNTDTFFFTNAAPQAASFNQGDTLWLGLETYLLENAATFQRRLVVVTAPVLDPTDPPYRGIRVPLRFVKVAAFVDGDAGLASTGYLLDQTPLVDDLAATMAAAEAAGDPPPLGPFRTFQVPVAEIALLTGLDLADLAAVDRLPVTTAASTHHRLHSYADVRWSA